jgi:hypothetical protein
MYILFKRHPLEDNEKIIGIFDNKDIVFDYMNKLYEKDYYCYSIMYYPLNEINNGKVIYYISEE